MGDQKDIEILGWEGHDRRILPSLEGIVTGTDSSSKTPGARARVPLLKAGQALFREWTRVVGHMNSPLLQQSAIHAFN
ncbi:hypothetical protein EVAR_81049_1 [Eumeta japonica]|uniref:Uncharacterized protein n=1 Tax=Eumeta variegata TaxID=151549 RepID=A0A4C1T6K8_EUMVA|nr:hypothetical protein EVAR_81049_1 [Eumeta japonica]